LVGKSLRVCAPPAECAVHLLPDLLHALVGLFAPFIQMASRVFAQVGNSFANILDGAGSAVQKFLFHLGSMRGPRGWKTAHQFESSPHLTLCRANGSANALGRASHAASISMLQGEFTRVFKHTALK
jgi:hypothetical protein